jgi:hypothetical protein
MIRVRRRHLRHPSSRPSRRAYRPYTRLITADEGVKMFSLGIDIGEIRRERATKYDDGWKDGFRYGYDEALRQLEEEN